MKKVLKTDKSRNEAIDKLQKQITALSQNLSKADSEHNEPIAQIIEEKKYQLELLQKKREWLYNFKPSKRFETHSTLAYTEEEAIRNAKKELGNPMDINEESFRINTLAD